MMYNNLIKMSDFACVGIITSSCNNAKLCIAINDAFNFDLESLLCFDFMQEIVTKWGEIDALEAERSALDLRLSSSTISQDEYDVAVAVVAASLDDLSHFYDLINGSIYTGYAGKSKRHQGIRALWVYYAYAHYIKINPFDDSPNGMTHKTNDFSMPATIPELNTMSTSYRNRAKMTFDKIKEYLCENKLNFTKFDACDCASSCSCSGACTCGHTRKLTGFKFRSISKR